MFHSFQIDLGGDERVSGRVYPRQARPIGATLLLAHGAGADQTSAFMVVFADALAARGLDVVTFNFPYTEKRRRVPDPQPRLEACYRAAIERASGGVTGIPQQPLIIGGKSLGGRIASHVASTRASDDPLVGLVFLGYPLHPPGKPRQLRSAHLPAIDVPVLIVQGSRDAFGSPDEIRAAFAPLGDRATLFVVEGGDHSLKVARRSAEPQDRVYAAVQDEIAGWAHRIVQAPGEGASRDAAHHQR